MPWLKYRHSFSHGLSELHWKYLGDLDLPKDLLDDVVNDIAEEYSYSDKYHGIDYEVVPSAPRLIVQAKLTNAQSQLRMAQTWVARYEALLVAALPCLQCCDLPCPVLSWEKLQQQVVACPSCGHNVLEVDLTSWLMTDQRAEIELLIDLSNAALQQKTYSFKHRDETLQATQQKLIRLGLAQGDLVGDKYTFKLTPRGLAEAQKWQAR